MYFKELGTITIEIHQAKIEAGILFRDVMVNLTVRMALTNEIAMSMKFPKINGAVRVVLLSNVREMGNVFP